MAEDTFLTPPNHPSLKKIEGLSAQKDAFYFKPTEESSVSKIIDKFNHKIAKGGGKTLAKLLKLGKPSLVKPINNLFNTTIDATFQSKLRMLKLQLYTRKTTQC